MKIQAFLGDQVQSSCPASEKITDKRQCQRSYRRIFDNFMLDGFLALHFCCAVFAGKTINLDGQVPPPRDNTTVLLGELGSMQMELHSMSQRMGVIELADLADYPTRFLDNAFPKSVSRIQ